MTSKLSEQLKEIIDQFTPDVVGIFWITKQVLNRDLKGFDELNYLFDGLISQYLYGQLDEKHLERKNTFFTHNFNKLLFLAHTQENAQTKQQLIEHMNILRYNQTEERRKILVLDESELTIQKSLQDQYPQFIFQPIEVL